MSPLPQPSILRPVAAGGRAVWVSHVPVGSNVQIRDGTGIIGQATAQHPVLAVAVAPVSGRVRAIIRRGGEEASSDPVRPVRDPGSAGPQPSFRSIDVDYGAFDVPIHDVLEGQDGGYQAPLRGRVHLPTDASGQVPDGLAARALVVIAHGMWEFASVDLDSHTGYDWLGAHLARWGMVTCSLDLSTANRQTTFEGLQQSARAEIVLAMIDRLLDDDAVARHLADPRIGLVGHSMGGEAVVVAQHLDRQRGGRHHIAAVASLAPTNYRTDTAAEDVAYLLVHGSADYLLGGDVRGDHRFNGFRQFDRAWRPRSLAWIEGARHQPWNTVWFDDETFPDPGPDPDHVLPAEQQRDLGRALLTSLFADKLLGIQQYRGFLSGPPSPQALHDAVVHRQGQEATVEVVDDFGDASQQHLLAPETPRDRAVNRRRQPVEATGDGLDVWQDVHHDDVPHGVHDTAGLDLAWRSADLRYHTELGTLEVDPDSWLALRVAQDYREVDDEPDETWNAFDRGLDLRVVLADDRHEAGVLLSAVSRVPYPLLRGRQVWTVFVTVRLPVTAFLAVQPSLNLTALRRVALHPVGAGPGRVLVDDIEFETTQTTDPSRLSMLRVHEAGTGFGPPTDFLDADVVVQLRERPGETFGFRLRPGPDLLTHERMLIQLRTSVTTGQPVRLAHRWSGPTVRRLVRVTMEA